MSDGRNKNDVNGDGQPRGSASWKTVNIFVSSTFNDMHAERDYLVKEVFPSLREWCERRKLRLVDVDLRWGVTEADVTKHKRVVDVCLGRIDDCRPFFVCLLGQRYGWVPKQADVADETRRKFPGLERLLETASVTELEILHSCVEPMSNRERAEHAFFYLREPAYVADLPSELGQLRRIYTDEAVKDPTLRAFLVGKLKELREAKIPATGRPVHFYEASWDPEHKTPEIAMPLRCPATIAENQEEWRRKWREEAGVVVTGLDVEEDASELAKAEAYNARLTGGRLGDFRCEGRSLGVTLCEDLKAAIAARFPDHVEVTQQTDLERELELHEEFVYTATEGFIERIGDFDMLDAWADDAADRRLMTVVAPGGVGKSTLLAKWVERRRNRGENVVCRFIGVGDRSASVDMLLHFLVEELRASGRLSVEIPDDPRKLRSKLGELLADCGKKGRLVVVIDALDQFESGLSELDWLPLELPEGMKLVVSFKRGEAGAEKLETNWRAGNRVHVHEHHGFDSFDDRKKLVRAYLDQFLKELDEEHLAALISASGADNPLFLRVVLSELRVFGAFGEIGNKIREDFGDTPISAFDAVLKRLEDDNASTGFDPRQVVPILYGLLAHSRAGLPKQALADLLLDELGFSEKSRAEVEAAVELYLRQVRQFLARREGRVDFFYASFRTAAQQRYARGDGTLPIRRTAEWHRCIARWCERWSELEDTSKDYALGALVHHHLGAGEAGRAAEAMTDFGYHYARIERLGAGDVVEVTRDFAALVRAKLPADRRETVETWRHFHSEIAHFLRRTGIRPDVELMQKAYAHADESPITRSVEAWLDRKGSEHWWFLRLGRQKELVRSACLRTLEGHTENVNSAALHADGWRVVSASDDGTLRVWDLLTGECLRVLDGRTRRVRSVRAHLDGRRIVSTGDDNALRVWDIETGECLKTLECQTEQGQYLSSVALHADGRRVVTGSGSWGPPDNAVRVWDLSTGECLRTMSGHTKDVISVACHRDGKRVVTGSRDNTLRVWDIESGECLKTLKDPTNWSQGLLSVALHIDGQLAAAASSTSAGGYVAVVWDLETGACVRSYVGRSDIVSSVRLHADGRWAMFQCSDSTMRAWDIETGAWRRVPEGHTDWVRSVAFDADGRHAVTGFGDKTIQVWDLKRDVPTVTTDRSDRHTGRVSSVAVHAEMGRAVTGSYDYTARVWDLETRECLKVLDLGRQGGYVHRVSLHQDGRRAMTVSWDEKVRIWDIETGQCLQTLAGENGKSVLFHPDGRRVVTVSQGNLVRVWNLDTGECLTTLVGHNAFVNAIALDVDGMRGVTGGADATVRVWELDTGECLRTLMGHTDAILSVVVHRDGRRVVSGSSDNTVRVWDIETGECLRTLEGHTDRVTSLALHADGRRVVTGSSRNSLTQGGDTTVRVWDIETGTCLRTMAGHEDQIESFALHVDGRNLVTGSRDATLRVWDIETGDCRAIGFGTSAFNALSMGSPLKNNRTPIVAGCEDGTVHFCELVPPGPLTHTAFAAWAPTHPRVVTALDCGEVILHQWHASSGHLEEIARSERILGTVISLCFSPDGLLLQLRRDDGSERVLDATTLREVPSVPACTWSAPRDLSADAQWRALITNGRLQIVPA